MSPAYVGWRVAGRAVARDPAWVTVVVEPRRLELLTLTLPA
jgi:hypothetical protein